MTFAALLVAVLSAQALAADCLVTETITRPDGSAVVGLKVEFAAVLPQANGSTMLAKPVTAVTNASGQLSVTLLQGAVVRVTAYDLGLNGKNIEIPAAGTANLRDLVASYISPSVPPSLDARQIKMGIGDSGLIAYGPTDSVASVIAELNQNAGSGGGGGGPVTFNQVKTALGNADSAIDFNGVGFEGLASLTTDLSGPLLVYSQSIFLRGPGNAWAALFPGLNTPHLSFGASSHITWTSTSATGTPDTGLERLAAGILGATDSNGTLTPFRAATAVGASDLVPKLQMDTALALKADASTVTTALAGKASTTHASTHSSASSDPITHNNLAGLTTGDPHTQYLLDTDRAAVNGVASLDGSTKVPVAQLPAATTSAVGAVELATDGETASGVVVQGNDARLSNARTPTAHQSSHASGGGDALSGNLDANGRLAVRANSTGTPSVRRRLNLIAGANVTIAQADDSGNEEVDVTIAASGGGGGGLGDGDYGDITVSGTSTALTIDNSVVTYAKMQNVSATDKCLGRISASAGIVEEITCTDFAQSLLDDIDAAAGRTTLGLGTLATQSGTFSGTSSGTNTGDQTITLTGNVTGSGTGSFATTIPSNTVTLAMMSNIATNTLIGRSTAGTGVPEAITLTAAGRALIDDADATAQRTTLGLGTLATQSGTFSGTSSGTNTGDQTVTLTGAVTGSGTASFATTLASNVVGTANITDGTVALADMANLAQDQFIGRTTASTGVPQTATITAAARTVLDDTTTGAMLTTLGAAGGTGTANGTNTGDQTITLTSDVTGSGTGSFAATIANDAVTLAKMANVATDVLLGRVSASTGDPEAIAITDYFQTLFDDVDAAAMRTTLGLGTAATTASSAYEVPLTFSTGLTRSTNTVTVNTTQNIAKLSNLTSNGCVQTSGSDGTLSITTCGGGGGGILDTWHFQAESFDDADANWPTTANAVMRDSVGTASVQTRNFLGASLTGAGGKLRIPSGATSCKFEWTYQASAAPGTTNNKVQWELGTRALGTTGSNTVTDFTVQTNANNTTMAYFSETVSLATLGLSTGTPYQFQLLRKTASVTNNMTQDAYLSEWDVSCF